jgi:ketosteroid isomerase-like protein
MLKRHCLLLSFLISCSSATTSTSLGDPARLVDSLLEVDRGFATAAADTHVVAALVRMFAADVVMPAPGGLLVRGRDSVAGLLSTNPANLMSRVRWTPIRGGISADGRHGFTLGFMEIIGPDAAVTPMKYLSYWVRDAGGWRVRAFKRGRRPPGVVSTTMRAAAVPPRLVPASDDSAVLRHLATDLANQERAFSDEARKVGLGPAFVAFGSSDAMHFGGPTDTTFVVGSEAIGAGVGAGESGPATISWGAEDVVVASSGDLGVSIGFIVPDADSTGAPPPRFPFFTIWRRDSTSAPWRYVAE